ncbi:MAG: flavin reductase [Alphaproteobacteria bacterium]
MSKITWKSGTMISPLPVVLVSSGTVEKPNVMTVAWTGIINSDPTITFVSIRPSRYSHEIISKSKEFVINLTNLALAEATDYCGVRSGRDEDKFKKMNLTAAKCEHVSAPQIEESPVSIECRVIEVKKYGTHDMFIAEVLAVNVDDKYVDEQGRLALEKAGLIAYVHGEYYTLGRKLGGFGFSVNKKRIAKEMQKEIEKEAPKAPKIEKTDRPERSERREGSFSRSDRPARPRRDENGSRPERSERRESSFSRSDRPARPRRYENGSRPERSERRENSFSRSDRPARPRRDENDSRPRPEKTFTNDQEKVKKKKYGKINKNK